MQAGTGLWQKAVRRTGVAFPGSSSSSSSKSDGRGSGRGSRRRWRRRRRRCRGGGGGKGSGLERIASWRKRERERERAGLGARVSMRMRSSMFTCQKRLPSARPPEPTSGRTTRLLLPCSPSAKLPEPARPPQNALPSLSPPLPSPLSPPLSPSLLPVHPPNRHLLRTPLPPFARQCAHHHFSARPRAPRPAWLLHYLDLRPTPFSSAAPGNPR